MSSEKKVQVAVVGATGYAGAELVRLLSGHPSVDVSVATSERDAGNALGDVHPYLAYSGLKLCRAEASVIADAAEFAFVALPHGASTAIVRELLECGLRVIDLGADFRFRDLELYSKWYGKHGEPELAGEAVYGLTEYAREHLRAARLVANPGCYPTGALLGLAPLADLIEGTVIVDSKSGTSGAGRTAASNQLFAEVNDNVRPYAVARHRHQPEIQTQLEARSGGSVSVLFSPHLVAMARGLLSTCYVALSDPDAIGQRFAAAYASEPFINVLGEGGLAEPRRVRGTNRAEIGWVSDRASGRVVVVTAIDNLGKGAAGQAVQNFNAMLGFAETLGLSQVAALP